MDMGTTIQVFSVGVLVGLIGGMLLCLWLWYRGHSESSFEGISNGIFGPSSNGNTSSTGAKANEAMAEVINKLSDVMARAMNSLPKIQEVSKVISGLSKEEREKLAIALGIEYQAGMTQIVAQEIEAIAKLRELGLCFSLYLSKVKLVAVSAPAELESIMQTIVEMEGIASKGEAELKTPEWKGVSKAAQAQKATELLREVAHVPESVIQDVTAPFLVLPDPTTREAGEGDNEVEIIDVPPIARRRTIPVNNEEIRASRNGHNHS